jgi:hypothetical protein
MTTPDKGRRRPPAKRPAGRQPAGKAPSPEPMETPAVDRAVPWLWHLAALASFWLLQFRVNLNSDIWFHLAAGRLIWQRKALPATDTWSFTAAGRFWQNHEWLSDVFFYLWTQVFGVDALVVWQWLVVGITYLLLFRLLHRTTGSYAVAYLLSLLALSLGTPFYEVRPHLWSMLGFMLLILLTAWRERPPLALPVLFLVWVNLHGGAVFGLMAAFVTLGCWALFAPAGEGGSPVEGWRQRAPYPAGLWVASCLATLVNPYGWRAIAYPFRLALTGRSATRTLLQEWLPPFQPGGQRAALYPAAIALFAVAAVVILARNLPRQRRLNWTVLGLGLLTLAMSLQSRRFVPFFGVAQALVVAQAWLAFVSRRPAAASRKTARLPTWRKLAVPLVLLVLAGWRLAPYPLGPNAFDPLSWASRQPVDSVSFMEANGLRGDVFAYYLWGGYLHWRTGGGLRVHFDTRSDTLFADETMRQHEHVTSLAGDATSIVDRSGAKFVLWPMNSPSFRGLVQKLTASRRWQPIYRDGVSVLLVRSDVTLPTQLNPTPDSGYHWWALGRQALDDQRLETATEALEHALTVDPRLWPACQELAVARAVQGDREATVQTVKRCQAIFPDLQLDAEELLKRGRPGGRG